jgi:hypothetical protein
MDAINLQDTFFERLATSFASMHQVRAGHHTTSNDTTKTKGFSHTEKIRMLGWCGLELTAYSDIPEIWAEIHAEAAKNGKKAILVTAFDPTTTGDHDIDIHVDQKLTEDIVSYNFGYGIGADYLVCHHGISPFAVAVHSRREKSVLDMNDQQTASATTRTYSDVKATRRGPPKPPGTVDELLQWMKNYTCFVQTLFGPVCPHLKQVKRIVTVIQANKRMMNSAIGRDMIIQILWAIFGDARQFFGKCAKEKDFDNPDNMPQSHLHAVHSILASKMELRLLDVPSELCSKQPQQPKGPPHNGGGGAQGGGQGEPRKGRYADRIPDNPADILHFRGWPNQFKTMLAELNDDPFLNLGQVCADSLTNIDDIKRPGHPNGCVRFFFWGRCNTSKCRLEHPQGDLEKDYICMLAKKLEPGIEKMKLGKRRRLGGHKRPWGA